MSTFAELSPVDLPRYLPPELRAVATAAELIRRGTDEQWDGGKGVCLGVSAFLSYLLTDQELDHSLANGVYRDSEGEHPHWWIVTASGWILDGSRGQFLEADGARRSTVSSRVDRAYSLRASWEPGHVSMALVEAEIDRCFGAPSQALEYLELCEFAWEEARSSAI